MPNRRERIIVTLAGLILLSGSLHAQQSEERMELRKRYLEWAQVEIVPTLSEWKARLDRSMAAEDFAVLNDLRAQAKELKKTIRASVVGVRKAWREEDYDALKEHRARLSEARKGYIDILDLLTPLAIEYRETLKGIGADARPYIETWRKEGREIWEQWKAEQGDDVKGDGRRLFRGKAFLGGLLDPDVRKEARAIRFMLWDGSVETDEDAAVEEPDLE